MTPRCYPNPCYALSARRKVREEEMPWYNSSADAPWHSSCIETCKTLHQFSKDPTPYCGSPTTSQRESLQPSGTACLGENPSISTKSSQPCTLSSWMKRERDAWDLLRYLPLQNLNDKSDREQTGLQPFVGPWKQSPSCSHIEGKSYLSTLSTLRACSQPNKLAPTQKSSYTINQFRTRSAEGKTSCSLTISNSRALVKPYSMLTGLNTINREGSDRNWEEL